MEMQSAMKTMMNSQFGSSGPQEALPDYQASPSVLPPVPHPVQENLDSKVQQYPEKSPTPPSASSINPAPPSSDISKEDVIGTVTRAHRETFMYNQETSEFKGEASHYKEERINNVNSVVNVARCPVGESQNYINGQHRGKNNMGCPYSHAVYYSNEQNINVSNSYSHKEFSKTPTIDISQAERMNGYPCNRGRRMYLVQTFLVYLLFRSTHRYVGFPL